MGKTISCCDAYELLLNGMNRKPVTEREKALCKSFFQSAWEAKNIELSAMQQRAEIAEKLYADEQEMRISEEKLRRAAEASIKASQQQEPHSRGNLGVWLYEAPVIPPDVKEVMDELLETSDKLEAVQRENTELTRKLKEENNLKNLYRGELEQTANQRDELSKLLSEAKSKAVPDGWQLVPKEPTDFQVTSAYEGQGEATSQCCEEIYALMLAAAPSPETDIDQEQRFK